MNPLILGPLVEMGKGLIDRIFPDKVKQAAERAAAEMQVKQLAIDAESKVTEALQTSDQAQVDINKIEAASDDKFKSYWRPAVGWVCVVGLSYQFLLQPLVAWGAAIAGIPVPPALDMSDLTYLLMGMMGLSVSRSFEKKHGVA